jgi:hypothetical protein
MSKFPQKKFLGFGLGLRHDHYETILNEKPSIDWFEILTENYMVPGGKPLYHLDKIRAMYPMVMHGVSMSIGSTDPLDLDYLRELKALIKRVEPKLNPNGFLIIYVGRVSRKKIRMICYRCLILQRLLNILLIKFNKYKNF